MNKWQRAGAGIYGAIENALDDLRHNWEKLWFDRKVTGEVNMFAMEAQQHEQITADILEKYIKEILEKYVNQDKEPPEQGRDTGQGQDVER
jgi:hypothetical protein